LAFQSMEQPIQTTIKTQALDMARSLIRNDFNAFSKYIHPAILEMAGGRENLKNNMDSANSAMKQFGVQFKKILIGTRELSFPIKINYNAWSQKIPICLLRWER